MYVEGDVASCGPGLLAEDPSGEPGDSAQVGSRHQLGSRRLDEEAGSLLADRIAPSEVVSLPFSPFSPPAEA